MTLAQTAFNNTQVREIRAESFYYYGRAYHAQNQLDQAFKASDCLWQYANELIMYTFFRSPISVPWNYGQSMCLHSSD